MMMRAAGLRGAADDRDPQVPRASVLVQEPAAGNLVPADRVVWFRTRTDVQANGVLRRWRLGAGQTAATYLVVAPDPVDPPAHGGRDHAACRPGQGVAGNRVQVAGVRGGQETGSIQLPARRCQVRCVVRLGAVDAGGELGIWTARVAKHSSPPAVVEVTVSFARP
jgi:hypothetical protein